MSTSTVNILEPITISSEEEGYRLWEAGVVQLGDKRFRAQIQELFPKGDFPGSTITWLIGARGAKYTLEPLSLTEPNGVYRIMSFTSGTFMRLKNGNELRVVLLGNVLEVL